MPLIYAGIVLIAASAALAPISTSSAETPLIPRKALFGNPDRVLPQLSPDGSKLAYLAPVDGVLNVWVAPADDLAKAQPVTHDAKRGVRNYFWAYTNNHVLYLQDKGGDENWRLYAVDLSSVKTKDLTPFDGVQVRVQQGSPKHPDEILIGLNKRDPQFHDLYRLNITTGDMTLVEENPGLLQGGYVAGYVTDEDFNIKLVQTLTPDGGAEIFKRGEDGAWATLVKAPQQDSLTTAPIALDLTGRFVYMIDSLGRNTAALTTIDLKTGETALIADDPLADAGGVMIHPTKKNVQAVSFNYERQHWRILDRSVERDFRTLRSVADGDFNIVSRTLDDTQWLVAYVTDEGPVRYYRYDRGAGEAHFLFTDRTALENVPLAKMRLVVIEARDGLKLVSYYTLPVGSDSDGDGAPDQPLPMALVVHGGPWGRDSWGYNSIHQWLANRGYAVLSVNFRGSTGFGKEFVNAGDMQWAGKMHDDLIDAVAWAVKKGIADADRVAIFGGSYGGYATLVCLTFTPDEFACGVDIAGPSNLVTLLDSIPPYWKAVGELFRTRVGDVSTPEGRAALLARSPITKVDQIIRPLLIGQGANDPRVKQAEADQIVAAMQKKNIPVTYALYPDEGHGLARPENRLSFFAVMEVFLAEHLSGRYEPIGDDFAGSSITMPVGAGQIPGVVAALGEH